MKPADRPKPPPLVAERAPRPFDRALVRRLAVIKVWQAGQGRGFDHAAFVARIERREVYDPADLARLLRRDKRVEIEQMIRTVLDGYRFLGDLDGDERRLAADIRQELRDMHATLSESCRLLATAASTTA